MSIELHNLKEQVMQNASSLSDIMHKANQLPNIIEGLQERQEWTEQALKRLERDGLNARVPCKQPELRKMRAMKSVWSVCFIGWCVITAYSLIHRPDIYSVLRCILSVPIFVIFQWFACRAFDKEKRLC